MEKRERIDYVDGLRGLAVGLVIARHLWLAFVPGAFLASAQGGLAGIAANWGSQGVSLFLVISGFCLSYPLWKKRETGVTAWFQPSVFFARRCLRILPPYYAALFLVLPLSVALGPRAAVWETTGSIGLQNVIEHVLLIHNNSAAHSGSINAAFWSLGLEWQWDLVFPVVILAFVRSPGRAVAGLALLAVGWMLVGMRFGGNAGQLVEMLPGRLFEFACGVACAFVLARSIRVAPAWLAVTAVLGLAVTDLPPIVGPPGLSQLLALSGLYQLLCGLCFSALLLLAARVQRCKRAFEVQPLVWFGTISYSVYLTHMPLLGLVALLKLPIALGAVLGLAACVGFGVVFHRLIERPCMHPATWKRVGGLLTRCFAWTDVAVVRISRSGTVATGSPVRRPSDGLLPLAVPPAE